MPCEHITDDLAGLVDADRATIDRHSEHLATCDDCRDARHDAKRIADLVADAGGDYVPPADLAERVLAKLAPVASGSVPVAEPVAPRVRVETVVKRPRKTRVWIAVGAATALAAGGAAIYALRGEAVIPSAKDDGGIATVTDVERAAKDAAGGVTIKTAAGVRTLAPGDSLGAGGELATDERTRAALALADGARLVLDHRTSLALGADEIKLDGGRIVAEVATDIPNITSRGVRIQSAGARFAVTASDATTSIEVVRGSVAVSANGKQDVVRAGEEATIEGGNLSVAAAPGLARGVEWSELAKPKKDDDSTAGLGALRAYKPGESRDRDWNLALAKHDVKVRIVGPLARTEITETFRNDSATTLEGVYQFPLPPDARIDALSVDVKGGFVDGAFVDKERAAKIWRGVIQKATPKVQVNPNDDIVWVQGPWRDPALLDWKRGGRFELRVYPIPAKGERTIKLAYTQVVTPRGPWRQYVYPLPHSRDGSTVVDQMAVDIEVRGATPGLVRTSGYDLVADSSRTDVNALTLHQSGFVPRGDLVVDYRAADGSSELRAWTFAGGAAQAPDDKLSAKKGVGIDSKVVDAQRAEASDARPTAVLALRPTLPRWREDKPRDYMIVIDASQSMVGERYTRASDLAVTMIGEMDRRDRFGVMTCDSECARLGDLRAPSLKAASDAKTWLAAQHPAGASDVVGAIREGSRDLAQGGDRQRWVIYVGDGFASTGFRRVADVERALADSTSAAAVHVSTIGVGTDADQAVLAAAARGGGGSYVAWRPGESIGTAAIAGLESTYGTALRSATIELPAGLTDVAPTVLPTVRAGEEVLIGARVSGDVSGDVVVRGSVGGQPFEQRYPLKLAVSSAAGNGFVPRLWASLAIDQLERTGRGDDRARIVALSQGYGVLSRETSLLVLESQAMFDAFGVDRRASATTWTGEDKLDEVEANGKNAVDTGGASGVFGHGSGFSMSGGRAAQKKAADSLQANPLADAKDDAPAKDPPPATRPPPAPVTAKGAVPPATRPPMDHRMRMIPMRRVWERIPAIATYDGVNAAITKAITDADAALATHPDSRESHRALVQALSYAGEIDRARDVANRWLERDRLDPQALGYEADLLGRDGQRDLALRTLAGLVDLDADRVSLHERLVGVYERAGRLAQACGHRIAIASLQAKDAKLAGNAARCLRSLGRDRDAELVLRALPDDTSRATAEKAATAAAVPARLAGDLVIKGRWDNGADLDISLVTPDGTRVSWMGGRTDVIAEDATSADHEALAIKSLRRGNYLIEISRGAASKGTVRGTLDVTALGLHRSLPFELTGQRATVGRLTVTLQSHLEEIQTWGGGF